MGPQILTCMPNSDCNLTVQLRFPRRNKIQTNWMSQKTLLSLVMRVCLLARRLTLERNLSSLRTGSQFCLFMHSIRSSDVDRASNDITGACHQVSPKDGPSKTYCRQASLPRCSRTWIESPFLAFRPSLSGWTLLHLGHFPFVS